MKFPIRISCSLQKTGAKHTILVPNPNFVHTLAQVVALRVPPLCPPGSLPQGPIIQSILRGGCLPGASGSPPSLSWGFHNTFWIVIC